MWINKVVFYLSVFVVNAVAAEVTPHKHSSSDEAVMLSFSVPHAPPFAETGEDGVSKGYMFEILEAVLDKSGVSYEHYPLPIKRHYRALLKGTCQVSFLYNKELEQKGLFYIGDKVALEQHISFYWKKGTVKKFTLPQIEGKKIAMIHGMRYADIGEIFEGKYRDIQLVQAPTQKAALHMLAIGRVDYVVAYDVMVNAALASGAEIDLEQHPYKKVANFLAVHKDVENAKDVLVLLEASLGEVEKDGTKQALYKKYNVPTW